MIFSAYSEFSSQRTFFLGKSLAPLTVLIFHKYIYIYIYIYIYYAHHHSWLSFILLFFSKCKSCLCPHVSCRWYVFWLFLIFAKPLLTPLTNSSLKTAHSNKDQGWHIYGDSFLSLSIDTKDSSFVSFLFIFLFFFKVGFFLSFLFREIAVCAHECVRGEFCWYQFIKMMKGLLILCVNMYKHYRYILSIYFEELTYIHTYIYMYKYEYIYI